MSLPSQAAAKFVSLLNEKFKNEEFASNQFGVEAGRKYDRITAEQKDGQNRHVHAFVDRETGVVYKSAGWKAPVLDPRFPDVETAAEAADLYGSYLYKR